METQSRAQLWWSSKDTPKNPALGKQCHAGLDGMVDTVDFSSHISAMALTEFFGSKCSSVH